MKRVKKVESDPNPLFMQWLREFKEEAVKKENSGLVKVYNMCIENLSRFPLPIETGTQCKILTGFGKTICARLDEKLAQHKAKHFSYHPPVSCTDLPRPELQFPVSPVAVPIDHPPSSPIRTMASPCRSSSYSPPKSAIFDQSPGHHIDLRSQEEKDLELALSLSQRGVGGPALSLSQRDVGGPVANVDVIQGQVSQADLDHQFALKLQAELNGDHRTEDVLTNVIQNKFSFDRENENVDNLPSCLDQDFVDDLPDIPDPAPTRSTRSNLDQTDDIAKRNNAKHAISLLSDLENEVPEDAFNKVFANDPVFNRMKKSAKNKVNANKSKALDGSTQSVSDITPVKNKKNRPQTPRSTPKTYVPKARSGAYAVLLTLYHESCTDGYPGYMSKAALCQTAQPLADQSFSLASVHTEHYTAWSGVTTLLRHGLVTKWSNPAKFNITDKGMELAGRIVSIENGAASGAGEDSVNSTNNKKRKLSDAGSSNKTTKAKNKKEVLNNFDVNSSDDDLALALELSKREVSSNRREDLVDSNSEVMKCLGVSGKDFDLGMSFSMEQTLTEEDFALPVTNTSIPEAIVSKAARHGTTVSNTVGQPSTSSSIPLPLALQNMYRNQMKTSVAEIDKHKPEFVLRKGTFEVVLCVDNTETAGGGVGGRKTLKIETVRHLQECGVKYDRRGLNIGDFLWIAREKVEEIQGQFTQRQPRELVLPYIVERKRLDDLWMSVKDGRYEEQKFRMKGCGLAHLYYLIEDHPGQKQFWGRAGQGGVLVTPEAIEQAIANTAVQEEFTVKKTADQKETIQYLTLVTRLLRDKYKHKDLTSCTNSDLADGLVGCRDTTLLTYKEFNESSKKNKQLTVTEVFAKMLLRLKGLSVDMAQAIVRTYPTPRDLVTAYDNCKNEVDKVKLLADMTYGMEGKRKIPKTVSEALVKFWNSPSLM